MKKLLTKVKYIDSFQFPVEIGVCDNVEAFNKEMKRLCKSERDFIKEDYSGGGLTRELTGSGGGCLIIVFINKKRLKGEDKHYIHGVVTHEAIHVFDIMMQFIGEREPGMEIRAYTIEEITKNILYELF